MLSNLIVCKTAFHSNNNGIHISHQIWWIRFDSSALIRSYLGILCLKIYYIFLRSDIQYSIDDEEEGLHKGDDGDNTTTTPIIKPNGNNKRSSPLASNGDLKGMNYLHVY